MRYCASTEAAGGRKGEAQREEGGGGGRRREENREAFLLHSGNSPTGCKSPPFQGEYGGLK